MSDAIIVAEPIGKGVIRVAFGISETFKRQTDGQQMVFVDLDDEDLTRLHDAFPPDPESETNVELYVARLLWSLAREEEDRCDMELEDMPTNHLVHRQARAIMRHLEGRDGGEV